MKVANAIRHQVGDQLPEFVEGPVTITDNVRYQGASGDMNPLHHDPAIAAAAGYPAPVLVGMRQAGVLANHLASHLGAHNVRRFRVQFRGLAWLGDVLTYRASIVQVRREDVDVFLDLEMHVIRQDGSEHLRGTATFISELN